LNPALKKSRDTKRKTELAQVGKFMAGSSCYVPSGGAGDYDIADLIDEVKAKYPQFAPVLSKTPKDPKSGTKTQSGYRYVLSPDKSKCAVYANLERADEEVTLPDLTEPTPGGRTGVLQAATAGPNGTDRYFQVSN
jgi:hypothetical protein